MRNVINDLIRVLARNTPAWNPTVQNKQMDKITITVSNETLGLAMTALDAVINDPREPERYREWYKEAKREIKGALYRIALIEAEKQQ